MKSFHKPVLLKEAVEFLKVKKDGVYIDATLGGGGHTEAILKKGGEVLGIDCDPEALAFSRERLVSACPPSAFSWKLVQGNFAHLKKIVHRSNFPKVAGILFDLGVSTHQLKKTQRGFSFQEDSFLDMRMDPELGVTAFDLVNRLSRKELERLFFEFGEEPEAKRVAEKICQVRRQKLIETTGALAGVIEKAKKRKTRRNHPATQCFQALRIAVNTELENLKEVLPQALEVLESGGRLVVISFHSLEDRLVKRFFIEEEKKGNLLILNKKPITPSEKEVWENRYSRSAKLRTAEKL